MEETWELAIVSDLFISSLASAILFILCALGLVVLLVFCAVFSDRTSKAPHQQAIDKLDLTDDQKNLLMRRFKAFKGTGAITYPAEKLSENDDRVNLADNRDWEFVQPEKSVYRKYLSEKQRSKAEDDKVTQQKYHRHSEFKKRFEQENESLLGQVRAISRRNKKKQRILTILGSVFALLSIFFVTSFHNYTSNLLGLDFNVSSIKEEFDTPSNPDDAIEYYLGSIELSSDKLSSATDLTVSEIALEAEKLKNAVAGLEKKFETQIAQSQAKQSDLIRKETEFKIKVDQFEKVQKLRKDEFDAVKAILFEESLETSRRYWFLGLICSIPLFWLSEFLKHFFLKLYTTRSQFNFLNRFFADETNSITPDTTMETTSNADV